MASTFVRHGLDISGQAVLEIFAALPELFLARPGIFGPAVKLILSRVVVIFVINSNIISSINSSINRPA